MHTWKDSYDAVVAEIIAGRRDVKLDDLCRQLDMLRDEVSAITERLVERGTIDKLDA
jgi:hypothetical protein